MSSYMIRQVPDDLKRAALERARSEGRSLAWITIQAWRSYVAMGLAGIRGGHREIVDEIAGEPLTGGQGEAASAAPKGRKAR